MERHSILASCGAPPPAAVKALLGKSETRGEGRERPNVCESFINSPGVQGATR